MRRIFALMAMVAIVATGGISGPAEAAKPRKGRPNLAACPPLAPLAAGEIGRALPLEVAKPMRKTVVSTAERLAVVSVGNQTVCVDIRMRGEITNLAISPEGRFVTFDWEGYEADGHVIIDRTGPGQMVDTGGPPSISPSRQRIAAVHQSEAAFSELQGFGVWQIAPVGIQIVTVVANIPELADWRIDSWTKEDCVDLSGVPFSRLSGGSASVATAPRDRFIAKPLGTTWRVTRSTLGCAGTP